MEFDKIKTFAQKYTDSWCSQNPESVASFFAPEGSLKVNNNDPAVGRAEITEVAKSFMDAFPDMQVSMDKLVKNNDRIEFHWTLEGTNIGPGGTGNKVKVSGLESWKLDSDGLILESLGSFDADEYERQLNLKT